MKLTHTFGYALARVARSEERSGSVQCGDALNEAVVSFGVLSHKTDRLTAERMSEQVNVSAVQPVLLNQRVHNEIADRSADHLGVCRR